MRLLKFEGSNVWQLESCHYLALKVLPTSVFAYD